MSEENDIRKPRSERRLAPVSLLGRRVDGDISALKACIRGLNKSTSPRMLKANLEFLLDRYLWHPSKELPEHLRPNERTTELSDGGTKMPRLQLTRNPAVRWSDWLDDDL